MAEFSRMQAFRYWARYIFILVIKGTTIQLQHAVNVRDGAVVFVKYVLQTFWIGSSTPVLI